MSDAATIKARLDQLDAERLILTTELRNELIRAAKELLPEAIRQAKPQRPEGRGKHKRPAKNGSPALLRLITRMAMRPTQIDKRPK